MVQFTNIIIFICCSLALGLAAVLLIKLKYNYNEIRRITRKLNELEKTLFHFESYKKNKKVLNVINLKCPFKIPPKLGFFNSISQKNIIDGFIGTRLKGFARIAPAQVATAALTPLWALLDISPEEKEKRKQSIVNNIKKGTFPISYSAVVTLLFLAVLIYIN